MSDKLEQPWSDSVLADTSRRDAAAEKDGRKGEETSTSTSEGDGNLGRWLPRWPFLWQLRALLGVKVTRGSGVSGVRGAVSLEEVRDCWLLLIPAAGDVGDSSLLVPTAGTCKVLS